MSTLPAQSTSGINVCPMCGAETHAPSPKAAGNARCPHDGVQILRCPEPGATVFRKYRFDGLIGAGGMGIIYRCYDSYMNKTVAIKTMLGHTIGAELAVRFQQEARAAGALNHPNIVCTNDFGITDDGNPYMVMEYFPGKTLARFLDEHRQFSLNECLRIFNQICDAVAFAHSRGVLHRDLKPSNIMLDETDGPAVKILDFGLAKLMETDKQALQLTRAGQIFGTPLYMSPEQSAGDELNAQSDIYSLGCVFFELLTGEPPFQADSILALAGKHKSETPANPSSIAIDKNIPAGLDQLVLDMLEKQKENRPSSVQIVSERLSIIQRELESSKPAHEIKNEQAITGTIFGALPADVPDPKHGKGMRHVMVIIALACLASLAYMLIGIPAEPPADTKLGYDLYPMSNTDLCAEAATKQLEYVPIGYTSISPAAYSTLCRDRKLKHVKFSNVTGVTAEGLSMLKDLPIEKLEFKETDLDDVCLRSIGEYSHLKELRIDGARAVGDRGMAHLASRDCPLVLLILHDTSVRGKGLANLTRLKKLKHLQLEGDRNNGLDDHDIEELAALKQLVNLELNGQVNLTDESVRSLSSLPNLQVLNLAYTGITARSISLLEKYPALRIVNLSACPKLKDAQKRLLEKKGLILAD